MEKRSVAWPGRVRDWIRSLDFTLARRFGLANREDRVFFILIGAVGVVGGLLGVATDFLIGSVQWLLWGEKGELLSIVPETPRWRVVAALAAGGALVGLILWISWLLRGRKREEAGGRVR